MNTSADDTSAALTALDTLFQAPDQDTWLESATRGLGEARSRIDCGKQTLDGMAIAALYDTCPGQATVSATLPASPWDNRLGIPTTANPENTNREILRGLGGGHTSIELHTSAPMHLGTLLADVDLALAAVSLRAGLQFDECARQMIKLADSQSIAVQDCSISFNADPLGLALKNGGLPVSMNDALEHMARFSQSAGSTFPRSKTVLVDVAIHHNAGASAVEELHAAIATATLYLERMLSAGANPAEAHQKISFQLALDSDMLIGIAKLRALDQLWLHVVTQLTGDLSLEVSANPVAETSRRVISCLDPWNNHLRNLAACMTAALAGTSTIVIHPHDTTEPELVARMARNLPIIVEREAGLRQVSDPMAGSYAIESLTQDLIDRTWQSLQQTDTSTQWLQQIQSGQWQTRLADTHTRRLALISSEQQIMIGVNRYLATASGRKLDSAASNSEQSSTQSHAMPALKAVRDAQEHEIDTEGAAP